MLRRDPRLRSLSSDHHHALVLARGARKAATSGDANACATMADALRASFGRELEPHFVVEEQWLLPPLERCGEGALVAKTREDHAAIRAQLSASSLGSPEALEALAARLEAHVRFEERELFEVAQTKLDDAALDAVMRNSPGLG